MTIIYSVALGSGTGSAALQTGTTNSRRYGVLFTATSSLIGKQIKSWKVNLRKALAPSGNVTCSIYDGATNLIATANEIVDSTTLPTSFANYTWTFTTPRTIAANDRLVIEYDNPSRIDIEIYITDQFDGANTMRTRWNGTAWVNGTTEEVAADIMDGTFVTATSIGRYDIRMTTCNTLMSRYAIMTKANASLTSRYAIGTLARSTLIGRYSIRTLVTSTLVGRYGIRGLTGLKTLIGRYSIRTLTGQKTLTGRYGIRTKASSTLRGIYGIRKTVASTLIARYRIFMKTTTNITGGITGYLYKNWSITDPKKEDIS